MTVYFLVENFLVKLSVKSSLPWWGRFKYTIFCVTAICTCNSGVSRIVLLFLHIFPHFQKMLEERIFVCFDSIYHSICPIKDSQIYACIYMYNVTYRFNPKKLNLEKQRVECLLRSWRVGELDIIINYYNLLFKDTNLELVDK